MDPFPHNPAGARLLRPLVTLFFLLYLALGLLLVRDYGVGWDEQYERLHGLVVMDYFNDLSGGRLFDQPLSGYKLDEYFNRHYGTAFQTLAMGMEFALGLDDTREYHLLRHYMTFLTWFIALVFFFRLLQRRFRNTAFSLLGVVFMILSPRIFADAFYNSKDIVFLSFYIVSSYTLVRFLEHPSWRSGSWHALATALLINTRILGIIMPAVTVLLVAVNVLAGKDIAKNAVFWLKQLLAWSIALFLFTVLLWPYLWENPAARLMESFRTMGHFPWDDPVLYWGRFIPATQLPFHYIPSWMLITTPVLYSCFFLAGLAVASLRLFRSRLDAGRLMDLSWLALFFLPLLAVIVLRSTLYDGWRQMFFLYGPFLLLAMTGFRSLLDLVKRITPIILSRWARMALFLLVLASLVSTSVFMVRNHPYQNVYFNFIAGKETTLRFEADYWGLSYRQALEYILEHDSRDSIPFFAINYPGRANLEILRPEQRARLFPAGPEQADYWLSNYRFPGEHGRYFRHDPPYDNVFWEKKVKGNPVVGVYVLKKDDL